MKPYLFLSCLLLGACASTPSLITDESMPSAISMPPFIVDSRVVEVPYSEANSHKNDVVRWGGVIIDVGNKEDFSLVQVRFHPLNESGRPQLDKPDEGLFVIKTSKFLDPEIYVENSEITTVGTLNGETEHTVHGKNVSIPLIVLSDSEVYPYLWVEDYNGSLYEPSVYALKFDRSDYPLYKEIFYLTDQRFFSTDNERSLLEETLVISAKTAVITVVVGGILFICMVGMCIPG